MAEIMEELIRLESKVEPRKITKVQGTKKMVITVDKWDFKDIINSIKNNRMQFWDDIAGEALVTWVFEIFDSNATDGFIYSNLSFGLSVVYVDNTIKYAASGNGEYKDADGNDAELDNDKWYESENLNSCFRKIFEYMDSFEDKYIPARDKLKTVIESVM